MLNRIYIVVGILAIVFLTAAFIVPRFIDWSSYRERMEALASEALGTQVQIRGAVDFVFLPQPQLKFENVVVGPEAAPFAQIAQAEAEFSLMDFLRDHYRITRVVLSDPVLNLRIDEAGLFDTPVRLPETVSASNVSIENAEIAGGTLQFSDARSGKTWRAEGIAGTVQISALRGPFVLNATADFENRPFALRVNTSSMNDEGSMRVNAFLRPQNGAFTVATEGLLLTGLEPHFSGELTYRASPGAAEAADEVRGDFVFESQVEASAGKILFSNYNVQPDENRTGTRLTGAAVITLGAEPAFDAVVSGGVVSLTPRDAREENPDATYELVRLLEEMPALAVPPLPGRIGADVTELDLRALVLREVRLDATTDGERWDVDGFTARLPGETTVTLAGRLEADAQRPAFAGTISAESKRLDALSMLWRSQPENNPLFNMPGSLSAEVRLEGERLVVDNGRFVLDGVASEVAGELTFGTHRTLDLEARVGSLDPDQSDALAALLPDIRGDSAFGMSFPTGSFDLGAEQIVLADLEGRALEAKGSWGSAAIVFDRLAAEDFGGARFDFRGSLTGDFARPVVAGRAHVAIADPQNTGALENGLNAVRAPQALKTRLLALLPASLNVELFEPSEQGGQRLTVTGDIGSAEIDAELGLSGGARNALSAPVIAAINFSSEEPDLFAAELGLGAESPIGEGQPVRVHMALEGTPSNSLDTDVIVTGGKDRAHYRGSLIVSDPSQLRGRGGIDFAISDLSPLAALVGAEEIVAGAVVGTAEVSFVGGEAIALSALDADVDGVRLTGSLSRSAEGDGALISGEVRAEKLQVETFAELLGGPTSLIQGQGLWPEGPFALIAAPRETRGRVHVEVPEIASGGRTLARDAAFDLLWDATNVRLRGLTAELGGGELRLDAGLCCAGVQAEKQVSGRVVVTDVDVDALLPAGSATNLNGVLTASAEFNATGANFAEMMAALTGDGSFSWRDLRIAELDPVAFATAANIENIVELAPEELTAIVANALKEGAFEAPAMSGVFTLAAGRARISNIAAEGEEARLFGGASLELGDLGIDGAWTLSPTGALDGPENNGLITENTARITALLEGTLFHPDRTLDLAPMVDAIKVRAYEIEVDRLEKLRAEQEARARAAAAERARLMELRAREEAERAAREAAERIAQEQEQRAERERQLQELLSEFPTDPQTQDQQTQEQQTQEQLDQQQTNGQGGPIELLLPPSGDQGSVTVLNLSGKALRDAISR